jgi:hypothetical protein
MRNPGLGPALALPDDTTRVVIAGLQNSALLGTASGWWALALPSQGAKRLSTESAEGGFGAISRSGAAAVIFTLSSRALHVYTGLPEAPVRLFSVDIAALPMPVTSAAVSDDAGTVLFATSDGRGGSFYLARNQAPLAELAQIGQVSAIRFLSDGNTAVVADGLWNNLLLADIGTTSRVRVLADSARGIAGPVDIALDESSGRIFVANAASKMLAVFSRSGEALTSVKCPFEPSRITLFNRSRIIAVTSPETGSVWTWQPDEPDGQFAFIPSVN